MQSALIPYSCGMFVYSEDTSIDANLQFSGGLQIPLCLLYNIMMVNFVHNYGCSLSSTNLEIFSVTLSQLETMGLMPIAFLHISFKKYCLDVLWFNGGLQNSYHGFERNFFFSGL